MSEQVKTDAFESPSHKCKPSIEAKLEALLKEYACQFTQDETTIGTTPLTEMIIDTGTSEPVSQKPYPITMKHYQWVKDERSYLQQRWYEEADPVGQHQSNLSQKEMEENA